MLGAIIGDIVGSRFEFGPPPQENFKLFTDDCAFTDDTVCTIAVADAILNCRPYREALLDWCARYPTLKGGYGPRFLQWLSEDGVHPMDSCGNGSAMRVSAVGWLFDDWQSVKAEAQKSSEVSHNHPEGIKGAQCVAETIFWLRNMRFPKADLEAKVRKFFGYELPSLKDVMKIGAEGHFDATCQETVPMALRCFLEANNFVETIRLAVLCDGDTDTKADIAGAVAEAYYDIPDEVIDRALDYLPDDMLRILDQYCSHVKEHLGTRRLGQAGRDA